VRLGFEVEDIGAANNSFRLGRIRMTGNDLCLEAEKPSDGTIRPGFRFQAGTNTFSFECGAININSKILTGLAAPLSASDAARLQDIPLASGSAASLVVGGANTAGVSSAWSRGDHKHAIDGIQSKRKGSDQSWTSDTNRVAVTGLQLVGSIGQRWQVEYTIYYDAGIAGDITFEPGTDAERIGGIGLDEAVTGQGGALKQVARTGGGTLDFGAPGSGIPATCFIRCTVILTATTFDLLAGQRVSSSTPLLILTGSTMVATLIP
jgi:hypothetical protein